MDFPGGPVAKTLSTQCREPGFNPWSGRQDFTCYNYDLAQPNKSVKTNIKK